MNFFVLSARVVLPLVLAAVLAGCASVNLGFSLPIGRSAGVGVSVGSDGRIGTSVGIGVGGGSVGVSTSGRLPPSSRTADEKKAEGR